MSVLDKLVAGSHTETLNQCDSEPGATTSSRSIETGSLDSALNYTETVSTSPAHSVLGYNSIQLEFFDKEEQKRREEYRSRVERHYCRLVEEERLSPESASVLSDAFAEAEDRAKYGGIKPRSEVIPEYHTGIDKTVWTAIDHQRSKSFERLKSKGKEALSDKSMCDDKQPSSGSVRSSLDMEVSVEAGDSCDNSTLRQEECDSDTPSLDDLCSSDQLSQEYDCSEAVTIERSKDDSENDVLSEGDEFDFENDKQREWRSKRGDLAVGRSMETWMGSQPRARADSEGEGRDFYKEKMKQYKERNAAKEREKLKEMLVQSAAMPSASPTPFDYDADEETSLKDNILSSEQSLEQSWSDLNPEEKGEEVILTGNDRCDGRGYVLKPMSSRSSVASEKSRLDPLTYQCYTAGLLHSSGKSDKFLKLQKHFAVLERIRDIENKTSMQGSVVIDEEEDPSAKMELFAKYDVQSMEELQWLYQELSEAQKNAEFFYDLQKLAVFQWKPTKDYGLKRRGKSLNDLKRVYEHLEEEEEEESYNKRTPGHLQNSFFQNAMRAERQRGTFHKGKAESKTPTGSPTKSGKSSPKFTPRALYGTNIPERLDDFEIYVESKKQKNKVEDEAADNLHIRSLSAPYSKHLQEEQARPQQGHKRSDSSKGSLFGKGSVPDKFEKKGKPTVVEVSPVQRPPSVLSKPPVFSEIMSGPHDFASRATTSDTIARPMQSNLHIYNSLENPQYQASVNLDEPMNARKLSRGRSNDNLMLQKDANGQYYVTESPPRGPERRTSNLCNYETQEASSKCPPGAERSRQTDQALHEDLTQAVNRPRTVRSGVDYSPVTGVRSVIQSIENKTTSTVPKPQSVRSDSKLRRKSEDSVDAKYKPVLNEKPANLARHPVWKDAENVPVTVEVKPESTVTSLKVLPFTETTTICKITEPVVGKTAASSEPQFKIRDLRSLAVNNEFSQYKFLPGKACQPESRQKTEVTPGATFIYPEIEPVFHQPVVGQIFRAPLKTKSVPDFVSESRKPYSFEARRNSDSSTDTFIIKGSDDEEDRSRRKPSESVSSQDAKSKSVPDLTEEFEPRRPRSAKSQGSLGQAGEEDLTSGRHCIPRTVSGEIHQIQNSYTLTAEFDTQSLEDSSGSLTPRNSPVDTASGRKTVPKQDSYEEYVPPPEIMSDLMRTHEQHKKSKGVDKPRTPSIVGKMTMDYLQEIGSEWQQSKEKKRRSPNTESQASALPDTTPFVGSDRTTTPNVWVPTLETRESRKQSEDSGPRPTRDSPKTREIDHVKARNFFEGLSSDQNLYKKDLSAPQKPLARKSSLKYKRAFEAGMVPRMFTDRQTNRARDSHSHDREYVPVAERGRSITAHTSCRVYSL